MHYDGYAFSKNGLPTLVPTSSVGIGQRVRLATCDIELIQTVYSQEFARR